MDILVRYVLVSQGVKVHETFDKFEALDMLKSNNVEWGKYVDRCIAAHEPYVDNKMFMYTEFVRDGIVCISRFKMGDIVLSYNSDIGRIHKHVIHEVLYSDGRISYYTMGGLTLGEPVVYETVEELRAGVEEFVDWDMEVRRIRAVYMLDRAISNFR